MQHSNFDVIDSNNLPEISGGPGIDIINDANRLVYPIDEARRALGGISRELIYELINSGKLRTFKIRTRRFVSKQSIIDYIQSAEQAA